MWFTFTVCTSGFYLFWYANDWCFVTELVSFLGAEMQRKRLQRFLNQHLRLASRNATERIIHCRKVKTGLRAYPTDKKNGLTRTCSKCRQRFLHPRSPCFYALFGCSPFFIKQIKPLMWRSRLLVCVFRTWYRLLNSPI